MTAPDVSAACARTLVDEWARAGVTDACLAPGSRSAPLALALTADPRLRVHVHLDERSAAFFALGAAKASGRPALVLCTSGTAAANLHPAVLEARHSRVPLLVCTADRPPELRDTGAPQTTDQVKLYGGDVRFFADITPDAHPDAMGSWRPVAARALAEATGPPPGPVHLNLAFREPLVPEPGAPEVAVVPGRDDGRPWVVSKPGRSAPSQADADDLAERIQAAERGVVVAGWGSGCDGDLIRAFAARAHWPLLADPLSGAWSTPPALSSYDALLRVPGFGDAHRPDLVVRFGAPPTSKAVTTWLDTSVPQVVVDPDGAWLDPSRSAGERLAVDPELLLRALDLRLLPGSAPPAVSAWTARWTEADDVARKALDEFLDSLDDPFEGRVARDVADTLAYGGTLVVASSMPVRDVESFARPRPGLRVLSNRGVNGIDGFTSTVLGVAAVTGGGSVAGLGGDLAFLHDVGGLYGVAGRELDATLVVVDNDGGGIFSFLPQAGLPAGDFEALFGTPHGLDLAAVAGAYGIPAERVARASDVQPALRRALQAGGVRVVVVATGERRLNVVRHREAWAAVATALA